MKTLEQHNIKLNFPFRLYWQQLFCPDTYVKFINPFSFWRRYQMNHLDACWEINLVHYLERCHKIEWQPTPLKKNPEPIKNYSKIQASQGLPWEKTPQNTIFVSQPSITLKYRGVTYFTSSVIVLNTHKIETTPTLVTLYNTTKSSPSDKSNNSKTSTDISQPY